MRGIQNPISPIIAAAILAALLCLPILGNISFNTSELEVQNKLMYNKTILESKRVNSP
jgi:hypothetical protein